VIDIAIAIDNRHCIASMGMVGMPKQNAKHKTQNSKRKMQNAKCNMQYAICKMQNAKCNGSISVRGIVCYLYLDSIQLWNQSFNCASVLKGIGIVASMG
jgi:hypothetical protein